MTHTLHTVTYSSVVVGEIVYIALMMVVLHHLEVKASDIFNAYVTTPNHGKIWKVQGPKFGDNAGSQALYGLQSAGVLFRAHLAQCMQEWGYHPCYASPDL